MSSSGVPLENPIILNVMPSYGSLLVGGFLSQAVWGISSLQVFLYFKNFEHDTLSLKLFVAALWVVDTVNAALTLTSVFRVLIVEYGRVAGLLDNNLGLIVHTLITAVVVFIVQLYFVRRIYLFGKKQFWIKPISGLWIILATWQLIGPIIYWVGASKKPLTEQTKPYYVNLNISLRAAAFCVDITLASCMIWLLTWNHGPYLSRTRKMIFRVLIVTINSGTWTALVALSVLILLKISPTTLYFCIPEFSLCSLYVSTFMANLNSRNYVRGEGGITTIFGTNLDNHSRRNTVGTIRGVHLFPRGGRTTLADASSTIVVTKQREVYTEQEYPMEV